MYSLEREQSIFDFGGVKVGGIPGKDPTVLVGTIFYRREELVQDEERGIFDRDEAERHIRLQEELSDISGIPCMLDIEGSTAQALERYIDFAVEVTEEPIMMGGPTPDVRLAGLRRAEEAGIQDRIIYNSLMPGCGSDEIAVIREAGVDSAVLLAYNVSELTTAGRIRALQGLLEEVSEGGIGKPLLDTFVMDVPSLGIAFDAFREAKERFGLPVGCGPHNAIGLWKGLKTKFGLKSRRPVVAAVNAFAASAGADWILYGPIETASIVFPAVAMVDTAMGFQRMQRGARLGRGHPMFRVA
jgi:tetrahydromethanopterin S-methyltransferase subunit H